MLDVTLIELFEKSIVENWDTPSLTDYELRTLNYSEVGKLLLKFGRFFRDVGIKKGDKITVVGKNSINWAVTYLSTVCYGAVIVPILSDFSSKDIQNTIEHSDSKLVFADTSIAELLEVNEITNLLAVISLDSLEVVHQKDDSITKAWESAENYFNEELKNITSDSFEIPNKIGNHDIAAIIYTSGTTGFSKGVVLQLNSLTVNVKYAQNEFNVPKGSTIVSFLPLAHCFGAAFDLLFPFSSGTHIYFLGQIPSPHILLRAFRKIKPVLVFSVPLVIEKIYRTRIKKAINKPYIKIITKIPFVNNFIFNLMRKRILKAFGGKVYMIIIGGAAFDPHIEEFMKKINLPLSVGYGMTECGPLISFANWQDHRMHSCGQTIPYLESKIDSPEPDKIIGELMVRGENVMQGYYKNDEATHDVLDAKSWLHTGDLGVMDDDGFIYLKGRLKNLILGPSGQNIYPEEIESILNEMPYVLESIIMDNQKNVIYALIYPDKDAAKKKGLSEDELHQKLQENLDKLNKQLPDYSRIQKLKVLNRSFKRTPTKKIMRHFYKDEI
ncbi:MAG: AMP-binding protein [Planctomycetes bacterium]|nr:AMP-binding protein [Planctomycetota bacterium]